MNECPTRFTPDPAARRPRPSAARPILPEPATDPFADADPDAIALRDGAVWSIDPPGRALRVRCVSGHVWMTQTGRPDDIVIGPGEVRGLPGWGKVVVQALDDAVVRIEC